MILLARKKQMTQVFTDNGLVVPVTILDCSECRVISGQKNSGKFVGIGKKTSPNKPELGKFGDDVPEYCVKVNDEDVVSLDVLSPGDVLTITGVSKGKGFAGVVRMWKFKGGNRTHGQSDRVRHPGSIGAGTTTGRVFKGLKMGRRKGGETVTVRNVKLISVDKKNGLLVVKGSVPGTYNSIVKMVRV